MEIDRSTAGQDQRRKFIELAISEIAAYKVSTLTDGYTARLLASADAIAEYVKMGTIRKD
jgi:nicotinamide riboside kinase